MLSLSVNRYNDIYAVPGGNLALSRGLDAVRENCEQAMMAVLGEMLFQVDEGMPMFETAFDSVNLPAFEAAARVTLLAVPNVTAVTEFTVTIAANVLRYTAVIASTFGPATLESVRNV